MDDLKAKGNLKNEGTPETRLKIINAAEEEFLEKGFGKAAMSGIAKRAGFSRPTLYFYFKTKEELYLIVFLKHSKIRWAYLEKSMEGKTTGYEKLLAFGEAYYKYAEQHPNRLKFMLHWDFNGLDMKKIRKEIDDEFYKPDLVAIANFHAALHLGKKDGSLRPDLNVPRASQYLCQTLRHMLNEVIVLKYFKKDFYYEFLNLFLDSLRYREEA